MLCNFEETMKESDNSIMSEALKNIFAAIGTIFLYLFFAVISFSVLGFVVVMAYLLLRLTLSLFGVNLPWVS